MRRSAAPSICKQGDLSSRIYQNKTVDPSEPGGHKLLIPQRQILRPTSLNVESKFKDGAQNYEIVYAKRSSKKHKKWEEDGMLSISGSVVQICSTEGKIIASASLKASVLSTVELGMILPVGAYECQLISSLSGVRDPDESKSAQLEQKPFTTVRNSIKKRTVNMAQGTIPGKGAFKLPSPPNSHVWKHNSEGLPITDVFLSETLATRLHPYQLDGIQFLYECVLGYRRLNYQQAFNSEVGDGETADIYGGILADEMGVGKTVQVIGLLSVLMKQGPYGGCPVIRRCLIVTPGSLVMNWQEEFNKWVGRDISIYCVSQDNPLKSYFSQMKPPPVIIISYEMLLQHADRIAEMASLDMIVCDEGHRLKNLEIKTTTALKRIPAHRRILLTGTPIQNDLNEFWSLAEFVAPGCLASSREEYRACIVNPLSRSLHSTELFKTLASVDGQVPEEIEAESGEICEALKRLKTALRVFLMRRTSAMITRRLPDKVEWIVFCEASSLQRELEIVLLKWVRNQLDYCDEDQMDFVDLPGEDSLDCASCESGVDVLACIMAFRKLFNHPFLLHSTLDRYGKENVRLSSVKKPLPDGLACSLLDILRREPPPAELDYPSLCLNSGKLAVLAHLLTQISQMSPDPASLSGTHRLVLVSNFTQTLDLLEPICRSITKSPCLRIDGKTPTKQRMDIVNRFNSPTCIETVLLLSSKAGGTGLNLIGADFLVLFDIDWNPATDAQALARIWREGQKRRVTLIRLVTADSLEERILQRQIAKSSLVTTAMSHLPSASLSLSELRELFQPSPRDVVCWTHELLSCQCQNTLDGDISSCQQEHPSFDEDDMRAFQLGRPEKRAKSKDEMSSATKGLGQIKTWNHFLTPEAIAKAVPLIGMLQYVRAIFQQVTTTSD